MADQFTFATTKFWKGTTSASVKLANIKQPTCSPSQPTIAGERYLLFIDSIEGTSSESVTTFAGEANVFRIESVPGITRYLAHPTRVSRRDVIAMLRGWHDRTITDSAMVRWLHDTIPVAEVDDWAKFDQDDEDEISFNLNVLRELDFRINQLSQADLSCELSVLRNRVMPVLLKVLEAEHLTPDLIDSLDQLPDDIERELCSDD